MQGQVPTSSSSNAGGLPKGMNPMKMAKMQKQLSNMMSPDMLRQVRQMAQQGGGRPNMQSMMQQMMESSGSSGLGGLSSLFTGGGGFPMLNNDMMAGRVQKTGVSKKKSK
ncbi:hypothetical protein HMI54_001524 [Coelomomyces lativittatus]|nr:hypothetical protein HMI55_000931 [Coelomomyces lativittatus]KAJ1510498.1 hypothetical protein HMI54_001524 [Coelomomyces lativittatus]